MRASITRCVSLVLAVAAVASGNKDGYCQCTDFELSETQDEESVFQQFGPGAFGDLTVFRQNVYRPERPMEVVGHIQGSCIYTIAVNPTTGQFEQECGGTFVLEQDSTEAGGSISAAGQLTAQPSDLAIIGGTGLYEGAWGTATITLLSANPGGDPVFGYHIHVCQQTCDL